MTFAQDAALNIDGAKVEGTSAILRMGKLHGLMSLS